MKIRELIKELEKLEHNCGDREIYILTSRDEEETIEDFSSWLIDDGETIEYFIETSLRKD